MKVTAYTRDHTKRGFWLRSRTRPDGSWTEIACNDLADLKREYRITKSALRPYRQWEIECFRGATPITLEEAP